MLAFNKYFFVLMPVKQIYIKNLICEILYKLLVLEISTKPISLLYIAKEITEVLVIIFLPIYIQGGRLFKHGWYPKF